MQQIQNILFISQGLTDETGVLKQALSIARAAEAKLKVLAVCPELPKEMVDYKDRYEASLVEQAKVSLQSARAALNLGDTDVSVDIEVESGGTPAVRIIRHVLKNSYDLLVKEAEPKEGGKGFKAVDMDLLRKCPCPVLLGRSIRKQGNEMKIAVAVDPESPTSEGRDLSLRLLEIGRAYADAHSGELHIISCWDYEFEGTLRHNPMLAIKAEEVDRMVLETRNQSRYALDSLIKQARISDRTHIYHIQGKADKVIPQQVEDAGVDILIMGTVARTGIPGFIIGNTAENVVQKLECSLMALKPDGFVSPVKV